MKYITKYDAALALKITERQLYRYIENKILRSKGQKIYREDVMFLALARIQSKLEKALILTSSYLKNRKRITGDKQ